MAVVDISVSSEIERLAAEQVQLIRMQHDALQKSPYFCTAKSEADEYDQRFMRIVEIRAALARFKHEES
jgi:hypothetical protein